MKTLFETGFRPAASFMPRRLGQWDETMGPVEEPITGEPTVMPPESEINPGYGTSPGAPASVVSQSQAAGALPTTSILNSLVSALAKAAPEAIKAFKSPTTVPTSTVKPGVVPGAGGGSLLDSSTLTYVGIGLAGLALLVVLFK